MDGSTYTKRMVAYVAAPDEWLGAHHEYTLGDYDLLMLGSHGHGTLSSLVLGSVATKVLANCRTPALLIR